MSGGEDRGDYPRDATARRFEVLAWTYGRWAAPLSAVLSFGVGLALTVGVFVATGAVAASDLADPATVLEALGRVGTYLRFVVGMSVGAFLTTLAVFSLRTPGEVIEGNPGIHPLGAAAGILLKLPVLYGVLWVLPVVADRWAHVAVVLAALLVALAAHSTFADWTGALPGVRPQEGRAALTAGGLLFVVGTVVAVALGPWTASSLADAVVVGVYATVVVVSTDTPRRFTMQTTESHLESRIFDEMLSEEEVEAAKEAFLDRTLGEPTESPAENFGEGAASAARAGTLARAEELGVDLEIDEGVGLDELGVYDDYLAAVERRRDLRETAPEGVAFSFDVESYRPDDGSTDPADVERLLERLDVAETYALAASRIDERLDGSIDGVADTGDGSDLQGVVATLVRATHPEHYDSVDDARRAAETLGSVALAFADVRDDEAAAGRILERYDASVGPVEAAPSPAELESIEAAFTAERE